MISIAEAERRGIKRVRKPIWAHPMDHVLIGSGPWLHLYCPFNKECNGRDPVDIMKMYSDLTTEEWEEYTGPLPESDEYKAAVAWFDSVLREEPK